MLILLELLGSCAGFSQRVRPPRRPGPDCGAGGSAEQTQVQIFYSAEKSAADSCHIQFFTVLKKSAADNCHILYFQ